MMQISPLTIEHLLAPIRVASDMPDLWRALAIATRQMDFTYFALTHHIHPKRWKNISIALHNCPAEWIEFYASRKLYKNDPILHASTLTSLGFHWDELPQLIDMTPKRLEILELYAEAGVGTGVTIPAHVPGEPTGSCTFATAKDQKFPTHNMLNAQLLGAFAFQSARRIAGLMASSGHVGRPLTPRQRDCLLWAMRGKSDWEIAQILNLSTATVTQHIDMARERYGVVKRLQLAVRAIYLGDISFDEVLF
jgi:LuxR family transcriptional regulator, quorum-sensing system regulator CciR